MIPTNSNQNLPCSPISSNCVVWQGPNLACIDLCTGDSISDVVAAIATKLCSIIDASCACEPDLAGLDLKCTLDTTEPEPANLVETLQTIVDYICTTVTPVTPLLPLAKCLTYQDQLGNIVTELPLVEWAQLIGRTICDLVTSVNSLNTNIVNLQSRITILENCVLPCGLNPSPNPNPDADAIVSCCIFPGQEVTINVLTLAIEQKYSQLAAAVGSTSAINNAISSQGITAADSRLAVPGTMGDITGWISSPQSLAETNTNQWKVIGDLYSAVSDIQAQLPAQCDGVNFVFTYNPISGSGNGSPDLINLNFQGTTIPQGFSDCGGSTIITITDSNGTFTKQSVIVSSLTQSTTGVNIDVSTLNTLSSLNLSIPFCVTDGVSQCADRQQVVIPLTIPCPAIVVAASTLSIQVNIVNPFGQEVIYTIAAISQTTGVQLGTTTISKPGSNVTYQFFGGTPGDTYDVVVTIEAGPNSISTCPKQSATIPGSLCANYEITTPSTNPVLALDYYLGLYDSGVTTTRYWYDPVSFLIKSENVGASIPCDSPTLSNPTMDYLAVPGDVAVTVAYTDPLPLSTETSYSLDGITYIGSTTGIDGVRVISTGQTSGSVYIKVETTCTGPLTSVPTIIRYDFSTLVWTTLQNPAVCVDTSLYTACPSGIEVARQYLDCGANQYNVFGGSANSYWFYVGKRNEIVNNTIQTKYIYAGWDNATQSVRTVVECCVCPTFILTDPIQVLVGHDGDSTTITVPYVLGAGEPAMSIVTNPVLGTVVQGAIANEFVYTAINPNGLKDYADTFQIQLQPTVPGTGECSLATAVIQIQYINANTLLKYTDQDVYAFVNTNGYSIANGTNLQLGLIALQNYWVAEFAYTGNLYFIPTDSKRWLGYPKSIVDNGASWLQSASIAWQGLEALPTSWTPGGVGVYKNAAITLIFSQDSSGDYHDSSLASGWGSGLTAQPTNSYNEDYDAYIDILTGTQSSVWATNLNITQPQFPDGLSTILYPFTVDGSGGADAANILQMIAAYTAELIPPSKYGIATAVDVTNYILQGRSGTMPYTGSTTPTNNITQLFDNNGAGMLALLDQEYSDEILTDISVGANDQFTETLTRAIKGSSNTYPVATVPTSNSYQLTDCANGDVWNATITDQSCGTIGNGVIVRIRNTGPTIPAGVKADWVAGVNKCLTVTNNCDATVAELPTDLSTTHIDCVSCTP